MKEETMRDELYDRDYQAGRDALYDGIDRLIARAMNGWRVLNAIQFDAPWHRKEVRRVTGQR
jgi:hypothetical protein